MLIIKNLSYRLVDGTKIFENISFNINGKVAIVGKNGIGKSMLLKNVVGELWPSSGEIIKDNINFSYFPQNFNAMNFKTIADVFSTGEKLKSLKKIEEGNGDVVDYEILNDEWDIEDKIQEKLKFFNLKFKDLNRDFSTLSGGEKVKIIISSLINKNTNLLILDEPTNNMDYQSKEIFYNFVKNWDKNILLVSHDRELLNLMDRIYEMRLIGGKDVKLFNYGGGYDDFEEQKSIEENALEDSFKNSLKNIDKQKKIALKNVEKLAKKKQQGESKLSNKKWTKSKLDLTIMSAEKTQGKLKNKFDKNLENIEKQKHELQYGREFKQIIYFKIKKLEVVKTKEVVNIENLNLSFGSKKLFNNFNLTINGGERILISGKNGAGKSTLLKIIANKANSFVGFLNQEQNLLNDSKTVLENIFEHNKLLNELQARNILAEFLFRTDVVYKKVADLSGGERLRLALAVIFAEKTPEILILDEPTNNLDLDSINILEKFLNEYNGTLIVVSHDRIFCENINLNITINLSNGNGSPNPFLIFPDNL